MCVSVYTQRDTHRSGHRTGGRPAGGARGDSREAWCRQRTGAFQRAATSPRTPQSAVQALNPPARPSPSPDPPSNSLRTLKWNRTQSRGAAGDTSKHSYSKVTCRTVQAKLTLVSRGQGWEEAFMKMVAFVCCSGA